MRNALVIPIWLLWCLLCVGGLTIAYCLFWLIDQFGKDHD